MIVDSWSYLVVVAVKIARDDGTRLAYFAALDIVHDH